MFARLDLPYIFVCGCLSVCACVFFARVFRVSVGVCLDIFIGFSFEGDVVTVRIFSGSLNGSLVAKGHDDNVNES